MGRKPIGKRAMTDAERQRRRRERLAAKSVVVPIRITTSQHPDAIRIDIVIGGDNAAIRTKVKNAILTAVNVVTGKRKKQPKRR